MKIGRVALPLYISILLMLLETDIVFGNGLKMGM